MRVVTFKVDEELLEDLDEFAMQNGKSRSEVIREAIREYLERHAKRKVKVKVIRIYS